MKKNIGKTLYFLIITFLFVNSMNINYKIPDNMKGDNNIMSLKKVGTCKKSPNKDLRFGVSHKMAENICCFNRNYAEPSGYWEKSDFLEDLSEDIWSQKSVSFYDTISNKELFNAPIKRSWPDFLEETKKHGWPSFRIDEVVSKNVRILKDGEVVSIDGTHLGHNIPDKKGNRLCINLVSISGKLPSNK